MNTTTNTTDLPISKENNPIDFKATSFLRYFGFTKIPLIFFVGPSVLKSSEDKCIIKIPLKRRTKNHFKAMYFGVLATGADCAGGFVAMKEIHESGKKVSLAFKEFHAEFLKRAEGDTYFTCHQTKEVKEFVQKVIASGERMNMPMEIIATCPDKLGDEPVAKFTLTLSLKAK